MDNIEELKKYKKSMEKSIGILESVLARDDKECCYDKKTLRYAINTLRRERED